MNIITFERGMGISRMEVLEEKVSEFISSSETEINAWLYPEEFTRLSRLFPQLTFSRACVRQGKQRPKKTNLNLYRINKTK